MAEGFPAVRIEDTALPPTSGNLGQMFHPGDAGYFVPTAMLPAGTRGYLPTDVLQAGAAGACSTPIARAQTALAPANFMPGYPQGFATGGRARGPSAVQGMATVRNQTPGGVAQMGRPIIGSSTQQIVQQACMTGGVIRILATGQPMMMTPQQYQQLMKATLIHGQEPLTASMLGSANPQEQKQMLGERLFPLIQRLHSELAGKITGMLLEMDNSELLMMLDCSDVLKSKVDEAVAVLQAHKVDNIITVSSIRQEKRKVEEAVAVLQAYNVTETKTVSSRRKWTSLLP